MNVAEIITAVFMVVGGYIVVFHHTRLGPKDPYGPRTGSFLITLGAVWGGTFLVYTTLNPETIKLWPYPALDTRTSILVALVVLGLVNRLLVDRQGILHMLLFAGVFSPASVHQLHTLMQGASIKEPWLFFAVLGLALIYAMPFGVERLTFFLRTLFRDTLYWTTAIIHVPWRILGYLGRIVYTPPPRDSSLVAYMQIHEPPVIGLRIRAKKHFLTIQCPVCQRNITVHMTKTDFAILHNACIHLHTVHRLKRTGEVHIQFRLPMWNTSIRALADYRALPDDQGPSTESLSQSTTPYPTQEQE